MGLSQTAVRLIAESLAKDTPGRARAVIFKVLQIGSMSALLAASLIYFGGGEWFSREIFKSAPMMAVVGLIALWVFIQTIQRLFGEIFRGLHDLRLASIFRGVVTSIVTVILLLWLWTNHEHNELHDVLSVSVIAYLVSALIAGALLIRKLSGLRGEGQISSSEIFVITWPLMIASIANAMMMRGDIWAAGIYLSDAEVAVYGSAARLVVVMSLPLTIASAILAPTISRLYTRGEKERLEYVMRAVATTAAIPVLLIFMLFIFFGEQLLLIIYTDPVFKNGWGVLVILGIGQIVNLWTGACTQLLIMTGHQVIVLKITLFSVVAAFTAAFVLVKIIGIYGVALAFSGGLALMCIAMTTYGARKVGLKTYIFINPIDILTIRRKLSKQRKS